jgi:hypothetical protein
VGSPYPSKTEKPGEPTSIRDDDARMSGNDGSVTHREATTAGTRHVGAAATGRTCAEERQIMRDGCGRHRRNQKEREEGKEEERLIEWRVRLACQMFNPSQPSTTTKQKI